MPGPAGMRWSCLTTLIALVAQFSLGMILNLYVSIPSSDQHAGYLKEIETAPAALTAHVLLGLLLIGAAALAMIRAVATRDVPMIALAAIGLGAILGAFAAGEMFVKSGANSESLWMAILTGVALVCYISALGRTSAAVFRQTTPVLMPAMETAPPRSVYSTPVHPAAGALPRRDPRMTGPQPRLAQPPLAGWAPPPANGNWPPPGQWPSPAGYRPAGRPPVQARRDFPPQADRPLPPRTW